MNIVRGKKKLTEEKYHKTQKHRDDGLVTLKVHQVQLHEVCHTDSGALSSASSSLEFPSLTLVFSSHLRKPWAPHQGLSLLTAVYLYFFSLMRLQATTWHSVLPKSTSSTLILCTITFSLSHTYCIQPWSVPSSYWPVPQALESGAHLDPTTTECMTLGKGLDLFPLGFLICKMER